MRKTFLIPSIFLAVSIISFGFSNEERLEYTNTHDELGTVDWLRDFETAKDLSVKEQKPILILFQEVPGCSTCRNYGHNVLSDPLLVEAIEDQFIPLAIYNNEGGEDRKVLDHFGEPSWNNPVVRIIDQDERMLAPRVSSNYSVLGLFNAMSTALNKQKKTIPEYMKLVGQELESNNHVEEEYYQMYCFWSGEVHMGEIEGVLATESGFMNGAEVVKVSFDSDVVSKNELNNHGSKASITSVEENNYRKSEKDTNYQIKHSAFKYLPLSDIQKTKINTALGNGQDASIYLSPKQKNWLQEAESSTAAQSILYHQKINEAWKTKDI